ncbi:MAG TPA: hypothetical protein VLS27_05325 [Gammaproteobacteria bacterium]|nr:hypothetical protein [Gammaproteobacteria bacterium]
MSRERKKPAGRGTRAARASLNEALNDLEQILEKQRPSADSGTKAVKETPSGRQYDIPLLDDVVMPGGGVANAPPAGYAPPEPPKPGSAEYEEACRLLVARIANEIEVIVQSRIESALQSATDEIRQQVKNHIEIMLPEILDEITHERDRQDE